MYQQHFGLRRALFERPIADDADVFLGARLRTVVENIEIASTTRDSALVLYGPAGLGKSTIAAHALRSASTRLAFAWLAATPQTDHELLELLLGELGFDARGLGRAERLHTWREYLRELGATDTRAFIAVENAHVLAVPVLQALESLTRADPNGGPGANLVLMGAPALCALLDDAALSHLAQRVRLRQRFVPFEPAETEAYLVHEVMAAGGNYDAVFARGAADTVHRFSGGVPRVINNLCATALEVAARRGARVVTPELVTLTAVDLCGLAQEAQPLGEPPAERRAVVEVLAGRRVGPVGRGGPDARGDYGPDASEEIPTLTESVDIDFENAAYELVISGTSS